MLSRVSAARSCSAWRLGCNTKAPLIGGSGRLFGTHTMLGETAAGVLNRWRTGVRIGWGASKNNTGFAFGVRWGQGRNRHLFDLGVTDGYSW
jgi:hypothetical protein